MSEPPAAIKGRGATYNPGNRYRRDTREPFDDGWGEEPNGSEAPRASDATHTGGGASAAGNDEPPGVEPAATPARPRTVVTIVPARSIIARNDSPDVPFDRSINPYQGCEHGCIYCFARPTHAYHDLSPGIDFETRILAKPNAAELLRRELAQPKYRCAPIALGTNTDPYQPAERTWQVTRSVLEVLCECEHPFTIVTKSAMVERDIDLIAPMAAKNMARVAVSITTLDRELARRLEPRAAAPQRRLEAIGTLAAAGIPVGVMVAPVIPQLNDRDLEHILEAAAAQGATTAGWIMLRLPLEVAPLFRAWLDAHYPLRAAHVMSLVQQTRGGRDYQSAFGTRMRGTGEYANLIEKRFHIACRRLGLNGHDVPDRSHVRAHAGLDVARFRPPQSHAPRAQLDLF